ncbi:MAG: uridine phosphorylase [Candidatus Hadarchaeota archaeon]|nr:uridine phosphorylase [Candidatus Hadarchaeota archaeon]
MAKIVSAERPETKEKRQYHISCAPGEVARYVLIPGDPERVPKIAKLWDESREVAHHREYRTFTGKAEGVPVSATSSGIGCPSLAIAVEELAAIGADTFIRVGSSGSIQREVKVGDLVISTGAVRLEGTSKQYVRVEYPAVANYEVLQALIRAAEKLDHRYHVGVMASTDSFYTGQGRPGRGGYSQSYLKDVVKDLQAARVLNFEMETASLLTIAGVYGFRAGSVCAAYANRVTGEFEAGKGEEEAAEVATEAVKILARMDEAKKRARKRY